MNSTECVFLNMKKTAKTSLKRRLFLALFSLFFACSALFLPLLSTSVYADPIKPTETIAETEKPSTTSEAETASSPEKTEEEKEKAEEELKNICTDQAGAIGWLICPSSGALSKAVDSIYGAIENFLVINPIPADDSSTIHIVWEYVRNITNIVFIIFLLVVVISHLTGFGINNYGLKRILPRVIIVAILVNLSFLICQIAVDLSNLLGHSLRGFFLSIEEQAILSGSIQKIEITWSDLVEFVTGSATAIGLSIALGGGLIAMFWTLLPVLLGAIVSIAIGFITIAMRQALVAVLVMIAPLAFVCFLLPNTEKWFTKWKDNLFRMLVFYPVFSFLFGASHLAGWAIITSSVNEKGETSGFGVLLGLAVQVFPLFFSWSLMKMSGTILGTINQKLHGLTAKPISALNRISQTNKDLAKSKYLATRPKGLGQDIMQRINDRQTRKEEDISKYSAQSKLRGQAYAARIRNRKGEFTKRAESFYEMQADSLNYQRQIERTKNDFNKGLGAIAEGEVARGIAEGKIGGRTRLASAKFLRLQQLDMKNVEASDTLKFEQARAEKIDYDNAAGFHDRVEQAFDAHIDQLKSGDMKHQRHTALGEGYGSLRASGLSRYDTIKEIMEGDIVGTYYTKANAAHNYATHNKIISGKFQTAFDLTPATQDVENQIRQLTSRADSTKNIDQIISGLRTINMRGDTDIVKKLIDETLADNKIQLGTHASQALANFCMFEVKDSDPMLRRFGKYINLETAAVYNDKEDPRKVRLQKNLTFDEYILGEYENPENAVYADGTVANATSKSKRNAKKLLEGTSLDNVERTFYSNLDSSVQKAIMSKYGKTQVVDDKGASHDVLTPEGVEAFKTMREDVYNAMGPAFIGASLKYPSGSEQLVSAVSFMTGLKEEDGELKKRWEDPGDALYGLGEDYFRTRTNNYLKDQIPAQILNMRTDYRASLTNRLFESLINSDTGERNRAKDKFKEILGLDHDLNDYEFDQLVLGTKEVKESTAANARTSIINDDKEKRKKINQYMVDKAGLVARKLWDENGTLGQLYKSRRSGAANNAKPFVRQWANLDNETEILDYLDAHTDKREKSTEASRTRRKANLDAIYEANRSDATVFYENSRDILIEEGLKIIFKKFEDYHIHHPDADAANLLVTLKGLVDDPANYV